MIGDVDDQLLAGAAFAPNLLCQRLELRDGARGRAGGPVRAAEPRAGQAHGGPGHGRRANLLTDYTFAVWSGSELVPVAVEKARKPSIVVLNAKRMRKQWAK